MFRQAIAQRSEKGKDTVNDFFAEMAGYERMDAWRANFTGVRWLDEFLAMAPGDTVSVHGYTFRFEGVGEPLVVGLRGFGREAADDRFADLVVGRLEDRPESDRGRYFAPLRGDPPPRLLARGPPHPQRGAGLDRHPALGPHRLLWVREGGHAFPRRVRPRGGGVRQREGRDQARVW